MDEPAPYKYLKPKPGSNYRQLFVNGRETFSFGRRRRGQFGARRRWSVLAQGVAESGVPAPTGAVRSVRPCTLFCAPQLRKSHGRLRAGTLYRETVGVEPLTPEAVADEYGLPVEAVLEAIEYCARNQALLDAERAREAARIGEAGRDRWPYAPRKPRTAG